MKDAKGSVLYVGKAKNIRQRLKQYFSLHDERIQVPFLLAHLEEIETILTQSEQEALVLEATLIRRFRPKYNLLLKDDKSKLCLHIGSEAFPRFSFVRELEKIDRGYTFGPYQRSEITRQLFDLVARLFQLRQCSHQTFLQRKRPCLLYQLQKCTAPCVGLVTEERYAEQVASAVAFLSGDLKEVREDLLKRMHEASKALAFERAGLLWKHVQSLDNVLSGRSEQIRDRTIDVVGIWQQSSIFSLAILHYNASTLVYAESWFFLLYEPSLYQEYQQQILVQYYLSLSSQEACPQEILLPKGEWDLDLLSSVLKTRFGRTVLFKQPQRGVKRTYVQLACDNARAACVQMEEREPSTLLSCLADQLQLRRVPKTIDCFDSSHLSGQDPVAVCVRFEDGRKDSSLYRTFHIQSTKQDDYAMAREVVERRYRENNFPDMIMIDGGYAHCSAVAEVLRHLGADSDLIALAKEEARHDYGLTQEKIFVYGKKAPIKLSRRSVVLQFLQQIRDEAHRFAISFQRKQRKRRAFRSQLDRIPGIGPKKKKKLLTAFAGVTAIAQASVSEVCERTGLSRVDAERVIEALQNRD